MNELEKWIHDDITWCGNVCTNKKCERNLANRKTVGGMFSMAMFRETDTCPLNNNKQDENIIDVEKATKGLEWILEGDRFGFGENWDKDAEPKSEEEQAGYNITRAFELLKEQQIVRCKDCKWRNTKACFCKAPNDVQDEWFCSEGEKNGKS